AAGQQVRASLILPDILDEMLAYLKGLEASKESTSKWCQRLLLTFKDETKGGWVVESDGDSLFFAMNGNALLSVKLPKTFLETVDPSSADEFLSVLCFRLRVWLLYISITGISVSAAVSLPC